VYLVQDLVHWRAFVLELSNLQVLRLWSSFAMCNRLAVKTAVCWDVAPCNLADTDDVSEKRTASIIRPTV
jgi:hypothetical protein